MLNIPTSQNLLFIITDIFLKNRRINSGNTMNFSSLFIIFGMDVATLYDEVQTILNHSS